MGSVGGCHGPRCERKPMPAKHDAPVPPKACATVGCPFQTTWHATLCCAGCKDQGKCSHGPRCERKPMPAKEDAPAQLAACKDDENCTSDSECEAKPRMSCIGT